MACFKAGPLMDSAVLAGWITSGLVAETPAKRSRHEEMTAKNRMMVTGSVWCAKVRMGDRTIEAVYALIY